ncbi:putative transcription factor interactor and regulator CCHC(Zn) family [Helianthus anomalus]
MAFLVSVFESYDSLIAGKIENYNMTKEDYDKIDPEEIGTDGYHVEYGKYYETSSKIVKIIGRQCGFVSNSKLGFDKSKVTCFRCKRKGPFKRECIYQENQDNINPLKDSFEHPYSF